MKALFETYLTRLREWLATLAPRERLMVGIAAAFSVFTALYLGIWEQLAGAHQQRAENLAQARAQATRLEAVGAESLQLRRAGNAGVAVNRNLSLLSAVDQASKSGTLGKPPARLQPEGDAEVKVWLEDVNFDGVVRWIAELETRYGVSVKTVDIERESAPGLVNARLSLVRP